MNSERNLLIEKTWEDEDMIELRFRANSERFAGEVEVYATCDQIAQVVRLLSGFPSSHPARHEFHFSASRGSNRAVLAFETSDSLGHCWAIISLFEKERSDENARISFGVEAAALDVFVRELRDVASGQSRSAVLLASSTIGMFPPSAV